jgi:hypothetical protein
MLFLIHQCLLGVFVTLMGDVNALFYLESK